MKKLKDLKNLEHFKPVYFTKLCPVYQRLSKKGDFVKVKDTMTGEIFEMLGDLDVHEDYYRIEPIPIVKFKDKNNNDQRKRLHN